MKIGELLNNYFEDEEITMNDFLLVYKSVIDNVIKGCGIDYEITDEDRVEWVQTIDSLKYLATTFGVVL